MSDTDETHSADPDSRSDDVAATDRTASPTAVATDEARRSDSGATITQIDAAAEDEAAPDDHPTAATSEAADDKVGATNRSPRRMNPVLWREARTRFESRRTGWLVLAYVVVLGGIVALVYSASINDGSGAPAVTRLGVTGRTVFEATLLVAALLIMMLVPPQAASTITGERERQTLLPMQITLLRPIQIVFGKLAASVMFTMLLITLTAPVLALGYVIGGVTIVNVVAGVAMLIVIAALTTTIAVWWSTMVRRSATAIVLTMFSLFVLVGGTSIAYTAVYVIDGGWNGSNPSAKAPAALLGPNPIIALADAVGEPENVVTFDQWGNRIFGGPLTFMKQSMISSSGGYSGETIFMPMPGDDFGAPVTVAVAFDDAGEIPMSEDPADEMSTTSMSEGDMSMSEDVSMSDGDLSGDVVSRSSVEFVVGDDGAVPEGMVQVDPDTGMPIDPDRLNRGGGGVIPVWGQFLIFAALAMLLTTWGASRRLRTPANSER